MRSMTWPDRNLLSTSSSLVSPGGEIFLQTRMASTGSSFSTSGLIATALAWLVLTAPTGVASVYDLARSSQRLSKVPYYDVVPVEREVSASNLRSRLKEIRGALAISISEVASIMGVSRQAVYKWLSGGPMSDVNRERFDDLSLAASILAPYTVNIAQVMSKRKNGTGHDLAASLHDGITAHKWAEDVARLLNDEQSQRRIIDQVVNSHRNAPTESDDLGVPLLDEQYD